jgi:hypothetical protein
VRGPGVRFLVIIFLRAVVLLLLRFLFAMMKLYIRRPQCGDVHPLIERPFGSIRKPDSAS